MGEYLTPFSRKYTKNLERAAVYLLYMNQKYYL